MNVIVVDDEKAALHLYLEAFLATPSEISYRFFHDQLEDILAYVAKNDVDGAFLDIRMPNIDGISLAYKLIALKPLIKIVFVTGYSVAKDDFGDELSSHVLGIIYKPLSQGVLENYLGLMEKGRNILSVKMFGSFDCFLHGQLVRFSSSKSKELFAFILANKGKSVSMEQAIDALWPEKDLDKAKILYRDAVWRLRSTLNEIQFPCVNFSRALLSLDKENIECDYYQFLEGADIYSGEFLTSYEWSIPIEGEIEYILASRRER